MESLRWIPGSISGSCVCQAAALRGRHHYPLPPLGSGPLQRDVEGVGSPTRSWRRLVLLGGPRFATCNAGPASLSTTALSGRERPLLLLQRFHRELVVGQAPTAPPNPGSAFASAPTHSGRNTPTHGCSAPQTGAPGST